MDISHRDAQHIAEGLVHHPDGIALVKPNSAVKATRKHQCRAQHENDKMQTSYVL